MTQGALPLGDPAAAPSAWSGKLSELLEVLTGECRAGEDGCWAYRVLRHGALVAVQVDSSDRDRRIVRIARKEAPSSEQGKKAWEHEVETFKRHLGIESWYPLPPVSGTGVAVRLKELWPGEVAPGKAKCERCGIGISYEVEWGERQRCTRCAMLAGTEGP